MKYLRLICNQLKPASSEYVAKSGLKVVDTEGSPLHNFEVKEKTLILFLKYLLIYFYYVVRCAKASLR